MMVSTTDGTVLEPRIPRSRKHKNVKIIKTGIMKKIKQILQWMQEVQNKVNEIQAKSLFGKM